MGSRKKYHEREMTQSSFILSDKYSMSKRVNQSERKPEVAKTTQPLSYQIKYQIPGWTKQMERSKSISNDSEDDKNFPKNTPDFMRSGIVESQEQSSKLQTFVFDSKIINDKLKDRALVLIKLDPSDTIIGEMVSQIEQKGFKVNAMKMI